MTMLITHVKLADLWGKKVFGADGHCLGRVVGIAGRRGVVRKVIVESAWRDHPAGIVLPAETNVEARGVMLPVLKPAGRPELRLVH